MKNILLFIDDLGSGGAQRQIVYLAKLLKNSNNNVKLLRYGEADFFLDELTLNDIEITTILSRTKIGRLLKIRKYIRMGWQDVLISFLETPNFIANISSIGGKKWKVITSERNAIETSFHGIKNKIYKKVEKYSDKIVCNSYNAKSLWIKYYPRFENKLYVIYNCVLDLSELTTQSYDIRQNGKTNMIVLGSFKSAKNPLGLLSALNLLTNEEKEKISIDWYGEKFAYDDNSLLYENVTEKINEYNLTNVIHLKNPSKQVYNKIIQYDVLGLFSEYEGFPNAVCEAMILSKPIIMTHVSDYNVLINDQNGILCEWNKPDTIACAIRKIISKSNSDLLEMGKESRFIALKYMDCNVFIDNWLKVIGFD